MLYCDPEMDALQTCICFYVVLHCYNHNLTNAKMKGMQGCPYNPWVMF